MIRRPPRSTLFPYNDALPISVVLARRVASGIARRQLHERKKRVVLVQHTVGREMDNVVARRDRKSTRLNSSHQIISYAVFCLKKKKKIPNIEHARMQQTQAQT